jgi:predicted CXXCH cytochrome family protein
MLITENDGACLECHDETAGDPARKEELGMSPSARPFNIKNELQKPVRHGIARCVDCHSVHGVELTPPGNVGLVFSGLKKKSTHRAFTDEADLCLSCHSLETSSTEDPNDLGRLFDPQNPSYHPVLAPGRAVEVPSLINTLTVESIINCTDCHTSDDPGGPRGPHGSQFGALLGARQILDDGNDESADTYALCYACHSRGIVLNADAFPYHRQHVVDERTSCSTCHNPHGAANARALIRFNDAASNSRVNPSSSGILLYESTAPGSGACYLSCHGKDHDPLGYGPGYSEDGTAKAGVSGADQVLPTMRGRGQRVRPIEPVEPATPQDLPRAERTPLVRKPPKPIPDIE